MTRAVVLALVELAAAGRSSRDLRRELELRWIAWRELAPALRTKLVRDELVVVKRDADGLAYVVLTRDGALVVAVAHALGYARRGRALTRSGREE